MFKVIPAFSRVKDKPKEYVQNKIWEHKTQVWNLLDSQKGIFYVCGDASHMARDVLLTVERIAREVGNLDETQARSYVEDLMQSGRYNQDVWA